MQKMQLREASQIAPLLNLQKMRPQDGPPLSLDRELRRVTQL